MTLLQLTDLPESELLDIQSLGECTMTASQSLTELAVRFLLNLLTCFVITRFLYFPKSRRTDYYFTFMIFSSAMLLLLHKMGSVEIGVGLTLGLFAIFGIIRYRTETVPIREMTYLFIIIAVAAINGLSAVYKVIDTADGMPCYAFSRQDVGISIITNVLIVALLFFLEHAWSLPRTATKQIQYDKIKLIVPQRRSELIADLTERTGLDIKDVEVGQIDFLKDSAMIRIIYRTDIVKILLPLLLLVGVDANGQPRAEVSQYDLRGRVSADFDWKIKKGLHLDAGYELRAEDNCSAVDRNQLNLGIAYSPVSFLDLGLGYYYIWHYDSEDVLKPRHRVYADAAVSHKYGSWKLSLRERLQMTHKAYDINVYQQTPSLLELKSRLKLAYKGRVHLEPYTYLELRNCLNGPSFTADYDEASGKYINYSFTGYSDAYPNRFRGALGMEWKIDRHQDIDFRLMFDKCCDKVIDTNAEGTKLKSFSWDNSMNAIMAVGYKYSF